MNANEMMVLGFVASMWRGVSRDEIAEHLGAAAPTYADDLIRSGHLAVHVDGARVTPKGAAAWATYVTSAFTVKVTP